MHRWHWQFSEGLPYLCCSLLEPWPHGFFTQQFAPRDPVQLTPILRPHAEVYRVHQVHGNTVFSTRYLQAESAGAEHQAVEPRDRPSADGLWSEHAHQAVWVCTADCTPVLIGDRGTGRVAALHAGWRGTAAKIVPLAIQDLQRHGSHLENLCIALGPAIAGEVYQVNVEVAAQVGATVVSPAMALDPNEIVSHLSQAPQPAILPDLVPGKARLDTRRIIALQLEQLGIAPPQVAIAPHCTYQEPEYFFSYRRSSRRQVQWSGMVSLDALL